MPEINILDSPEEHRSNKKSKSVRFLIAGGGLILLVFVMAVFSEIFGLIESYAAGMIAGFGIIIGFALNITGVILGIIELVKKRKWALLGLLGNLGFILFFILIMVVGLTS